MNTIKNFTNLLDAKNYAYEVEADAVIVTHQGSVYLASLTTLPENTQFNNKGYVDLRSLTTLPEGTQFNNKGSVDLDSLTTLPEGTQFNNKGYVYLTSLTTLPEGTQFNNKGSVDLDSLDHTSIVYRGKRRVVRHIDGSTMIVSSTKPFNGGSIMLARYFKGGEFKDMSKCYIAKIGKYYAHGETIVQAVSDARFKHLQSTMDLSSVVQKIKDEGSFTRETFRLFTGACSFGTEEFLKDRNLASKKKLPIKDVVEITRGQFGGDKIEEYFGECA